MNIRTRIVSVRRRLAAKLRSTRGVIDLASVMVGIIIIGIVGGIVAAAVFAVIPWSQDNAATASLDTVKTVQAVARARTADNGVGRYLDLSGLETEKLLQPSGTQLKVATDEAGTCWVATVTSQTGTVFTSSNTTDTRVLHGGEPTDCADLSVPVEPTKLVRTPVELAAAFSEATNGAVVGIDADFTSTMSDPEVGVPAGTALALDLRGHTIKLAGSNNSAAIAVPGTASLTITDTRGTGKLVASSRGGAGIGASFGYGMEEGAPTSVGAITIDHAHVEATASGIDSAGIGGSANQLRSVGPITIRNHSTVTALGSGYGAGIGGGGLSGNGDISISDSTVTIPAGGGGGAGIGAGQNGFGDLDGLPWKTGTITITGSTVTVHGGATAIGAGSSSQDAGTITIASSTVRATAGDNNSSVIGGSSMTRGGRIQLKEATITAAWLYPNTPEMGLPDLIGNGFHATGVSVSITSSTVNGNSVG